MALRTMKADERRDVLAWFDHLKNWEQDPYVRKKAVQLPDTDVQLLTTSEGIHIFFEKDDSTITILDLATKATIDQFADVE